MGIADDIRKDNPDSPDMKALLAKIRHRLDYHGSQGRKAAGNRIAHSMCDYSTPPAESHKRHQHMY